MKKFFRFIIVLIVIAVALLLLKPSSKDFETWVKRDAVKQRGNAKGDNFVEKLVDKGVTTATQVQILATYRYTDKTVFAFVEANANMEKLEFVGVAGIWIPLP